MDKEAFKTKTTCLLRRAGLANVPIPVLACSAFIAIALVAFGVWHFGFGGTQDGSPDFEVVAGSGNAEPSSSLENAADSSSIAIDVEGCVKNPGLYDLAPDARIGDAVTAAGGLTKSAARSQLNLAQKLEDGQQIYVQSKKQVARAQNLTSGDAASGAAAEGSTTSSSRQGSTASAGKASGKIDINSATADELQKLSGVGESISQRIIDYRDKNGSFSKIEDLMKVSGIGEARFAAIKDDICV